MPCVARPPPRRAPPFRSGRSLHRRAPAPRARRSLASRAHDPEDDWLERMSSAASRARERENAAAADDADDGTSEPEHGDLTESAANAMLGVDPDLGSAPSGPPAVLLFGFPKRATAETRVLLDELGGYDVPVIPLGAEHAWRTLRACAMEPEPDWTRPRVDDGLAGGGGGPSRALAFSGLDLGEIALIVSAIEARGGANVPVVIASEDNLDKPLGEALAGALTRAREARRRRRRDVGKGDAGARARDAASSSSVETVVDGATSTPTAPPPPPSSESSEPVASPSASRPSVVSESQLREIARARGVDHDALLADARSNGVVSPE